MKLLSNLPMKRFKHSPSQDENLEMNITKNPDRNRALVLSGGGAKSIFQAQAMERLNEEGYEFDLIAGVSAGSLNAAIASQKSNNLVDLWKQVDRKDIFSGGFTAFRIFKMLFGLRNSFYDNDPLERFLKKHYDPGKTKIPFIVGTVNLQTAEYNEFEIGAKGDLTRWRKEEIHKAIVASSSIPLLFPAVTELGLQKSHMFVDGGLRNITPLASIIKRDIDEILVITTSPRQLGTTTETLKGPFDFAERSLDILTNEVLREDIDSVLKVNRIIKQCDNEIRASDGHIYRHIDISLIEPRFRLGSMLDFSDETQEKRIEEANRVCDRMIKHTNKSLSISKSPE